jgi:hypothetical protein
MAQSTVSLRGVARPRSRVFEKLDDFGAELAVGSLVDRPLNAHVMDAITAHVEAHGIGRNDLLFPLGLQEAML